MPCEITRNFGKNKGEKVIQIDKTDVLYKYLTNLGAENVDELYTELAQNGRYKRQDVKNYFRAEFQPSLTTEIKEEQLMQVLDYFIDIKSTKTIKKAELKPKLAEYYATKSRSIKEQIINFALKDVLYMCLNYKSLHNDVDLQDLVQIANLGLLQALNAYNPNAKIEFEDYVLFWVRTAVLNEFKEKKND